MSEVIMKKSIFIEAVAIKEIKFCTEYTTWDRLNKLPAISTVNILIKTIELPIPLLSQGDSFYLEDINQIVLIHKVMRTSANNVAYLVCTKEVEDETSKLQYEKDKEAFLLRDQLQKENKDLKYELEGYKQLIAKAKRDLPKSFYKLFES